MIWTWTSMALAGGTFAATEDGHATHPTWSPDGKRLAFEATLQSGQNALYLATPGELGVRRVHLATNFGDLGRATWHRSGSLVVEGGRTGASRLWYVAPGTTSLSELIGHQELSGQLGSPWISPRGDTLVFLADGRPRLRQIGTDLTVRTIEVDGRLSEPTITADGSRVAFTRDEDDRDVVVWSADGTAVAAGGPGDQEGPAWGAAGTLLVYAERDGTWDLTALRLGGTQVLVAGVDRPAQATAAVSPDGAWVAWTRTDPRGCHAGITSVDGKVTVPVAITGTGCADPALGLRDGAPVLAVTAVPEGGGWRHVVWTEVPLPSP
ncbi:MAG: PD40 domain-containing protein [Alphaproteobacteria bacterium]|nr:PD40 domain-containing protein [Alphaproteobacteria bacterium]MCB9698822.1 PD40 domain-containing protein [Alphaproteobacteria bacterium]